MAALAHEREELEEREETILEGMTTARTWAWAGFSVVAVAIMLFGYLVARSITGPLHELTEATKRFGAGDYSARVDPESRDELGQLATAFNDMIKSQRHADEALREAHEQLEARVQERTQELRTVNETLNAQEKELRKNAENLRRLTGKLIVAQENERRRIGRELHDDLTQNLAAMAIDAGRLEQQAEATEDRDEDGLCKIKVRLIELSEYVLTLSRQLDPTIVEELGIAAALHSLCEELEQNKGVQIDYEADAIPADIPNDQALCIYRVAQEALRNIIKHSRATRAQVHLRLKKGTLQFQVKDNGIGFNPDEERNQIGSGLASIEERVWFAGGTVQVETGPGDGTVISVSIPLT